MAPSRRLAVVSLLACALSVACGTGEDRPGSGRDAAAPGLAGFSAPEAPVVLVSVDTLRADRLPAYGYDRVETPAFDRLAADSLVFESAWAHAPLTLPSHASLLTGLLPGTHGVRDNLGYELDPETVTLAEWLRDMGYRTGAGVAAFPMRAETGLDAGFDVYDDELTIAAGAGVGEIQRPGSEVLAAVRDWLDAAPERPFLFFHVFEPHLPWTPPPAIEARYGATYDAEVVAADAVVGGLLEELDRRDLYDPALIVFLSDHGEGLGDHGEEEHGILLHREVLRVPLMVKLPGSRAAGTRVAAAAQLVDVFPTVAAVVGGAPPQDLAGRSLLEVAAGEVGSRSLYGETWAPRLHFGWSELYSLVEHPWHYIHGPRPELYDVVADPGETEDLASEGRHADRVAAMAARVEEMQVEAELPGQVDAEARRRLESLGYLSGGGGPDDGFLEDPKSQLPLLDELKRAAQLLYEERYREAADRYRELLGDDPDLVTGWEHLGRAELALGRLDRAVAAFERLEELDPDYPELGVRLAAMYVQLGRLDDAVGRARVAAQREPAAAATVLANVALRRQDLAEAERQARAAVEADPGFFRGWVALSEARLQAGDPEEALQAAGRALEAAEADPDPTSPRGLRVLRGRILGVAGQLDEAAAAFAAEIEAFPESLDGWTYLAAIRFARSGPAAGQALLERMVETNPGPEAEAEAVRTLRRLGADEEARDWLRRALQRYPDDPRLANMGG